MSGRDREPGRNRSGNPKANAIGNGLEVSSPSATLRHDGEGSRGATVLKSRGAPSPAAEPGRAPSLGVCPAAARGASVAPEKGGGERGERPESAASSPRPILRAAPRGRAPEPGPYAAARPGPRPKPGNFSACGVGGGSEGGLGSRSAQGGP